jgi:hypothetical protein
MAGYVRQDVSNNIADGNIINASDFDNEYNAIEAAFNASTGHTHDGTAAEGAPITKIGPTQDVVASASALTPKVDNTVDLGSATFEFKDLWLDGVANIDSLVVGVADISGTTTLSGLTASTALALNASKEIVSVTNTGTGNNVLATSPVLVTPNLGTPSIVTGINDTNGNELFLFTATASAVNEVTLANAATGNAPKLSATGGDTDIDFVLAAKGAGQVKETVLGSDYALASQFDVGTAPNEIPLNQYLGTLAFQSDDAVSVGYIRSNAVTGSGYALGAGSAVTQVTSRTTGVTINAACGAITLVSDAGTTTPASFTVTNSSVAATDVVILSQKSGTDKYVLLVTAVAAGSFEITAYTTGGTTTEQPVINFAVIKAVAA